MNNKKNYASNNKNKFNQNLEKNSEYFKLNKNLNVNEN